MSSMSMGMDRDTLEWIEDKRENGIEMKNIK